MSIIIHILIISTVGMIMLALDNVLPPVKLKTKYFLWSLLMLIYMFPVSGLNPLSVLTIGSNVSSDSNESIASTLVLSSLNHENTSRMPFSYMTILFIFWILVVLTLAIRAIIAQVRLKNYIHRCGTTISRKEIQSLISKRSYKKFENLSLDVRFVPEFNTPAIIGLTNPIIIIPKNINYSYSELRLVLLHELYHLYRRDHLIRFSQNIVVILFWYLPPIYLFRKEAIRYCELSCDEYILCDSSVDNRKLYFNTLLRTARSPIDNRGIACVNLRGNSEINIFKERIENIVNFKVRNKAGYTIVLLMFFLIISLSFLVGCEKTPQIPNKQEITLLDNKSIIDKEVSLDYESLNEFEYTHVIRYSTWDEAKENYQPTLVVEDTFDGFQFSGELKLNSAQAVDSETTDEFDVYYIGTMFKH